MDGIRQRGLENHAISLRRSAAPAMIISAPALLAFHSIATVSRTNGKRQV